MNLRALFRLLLLTLSLNPVLSADLKIGIIGLDTSHCTEFTRILNDPTTPGYVPGGKVVAAVKTFSPDIESSASTVEKYTAILRDQYGVKIVPTIEDLLREVDCVMIESVDGRPHLEQARPVIAAKKRLFIDKPIGGTLRTRSRFSAWPKPRGSRCSLHRAIGITRPWWN